MNILIATSKRPINEDGANEFSAVLRQGLKDRGLEITSGIVWTAGPGCVNLAFTIEGPSPELETAINGLTLELMPARWCETDDVPPTTDLFDLRPI